jgi:hypothetical protein
MKRVNEEFIPSFAEGTCSDATFSRKVSDSGSYDKGLHLEDHRVARFLVLLQRVDQSVGGLSALPTPELHEIVTSAIQLSGFVDPAEGRDLIVCVLTAIEKHDLIPEAPLVPSAMLPGD